MKTVWIGLALAFMLPGPTRGEALRPTPEQFRSGFNDALSRRGLTMRMAAWKAEKPAAPSVAAEVTSNIQAFAQLDDARGVSSVLLLMHTTGSVESVVQIIAAVAATTYAANPELPQQDRELLFAELGFYDEGWSGRGLDGIASRKGHTYRVIHPGNDTLVIAVVSWNAGVEPTSPFVF